MRESQGLANVLGGDEFYDLQKTINPARRRDTWDYWRYRFVSSLKVPHPNSVIGVHFQPSSSPMPQDVWVKYIVENRKRARRLDDNTWGFKLW